MLRSGRPHAPSVRCLSPGVLGFFAREFRNLSFLSSPYLPALDRTESTFRGTPCGLSPCPLVTDSFSPAASPPPSRAGAGAGARAGAGAGVSTHPAAPSARRTDARRAPSPRRGPRAPRAPRACTPAPRLHTHARHRARRAPFPATPRTAHRIELRPARPPRVCTRAAPPAIYTPPRRPRCTHAPHTYTQHPDCSHCPWPASHPLPAQLPILPSP